MPPVMWSVLGTMFDSAARQVFEPERKRPGFVYYYFLSPLMLRYLRCLSVEPREKQKELTTKSVGDL